MLNLKVLNAHDTKQKIMLIKKLNEIKQAVAFQRLWFTEKYGHSNWLTQMIISFRLRESFWLESKIQVLQARLSVLCSHTCSYLVEYDKLDKALHAEWIAEISDLIKEIGSIEYLKKVIHEKPQIKETPFITDIPSTPDMLLLVDSQEMTAIEHYNGFKLSKNWPEITAQQLEDWFSSVETTVIDNVESLNVMVQLIGKEDAWDWKRGNAKKWLKGRLN